MTVERNDDRNESWIGRDVPSNEGQRLVAGQGEYLANLHSASTVHAAFVRSPYAHARVLGIDPSAALTLPGVHAVITGDELARHTEPVLSSDVLHMGEPMVHLARLPTFYALSHDEVHFVGDPVAMVIADSRHLAEDGAQLVEVDYEVLAPVTDASTAREPGSPTVHSEWPDNTGIALDMQEGPVDEVFAGADRVLQYRFSVHRSGYPPLEPLVAVAKWDGRDGLTLWLTNQRVHMARVAVADVLRLPAALVRVIAPRDIGGGFGWKIPIYREPLAVAYAATRLGRPVTWVQDRYEALVSGGHEREAVVDVAGAFDGEGRLRGLRTHAVTDVGCAKLDQYNYMPAVLTTPTNPYGVEAFAHRAEGVLTNKAPLAVQRPAGRMAIAFALERFMDRAAAELGVDPVDLRMANLGETPKPTLHGDFRGAMERLLREMEYSKLTAWAEEQRAVGRHIGVGVSLTVDSAAPIPSFMGAVGYGQPFYGSARVRVEVDGEVVVFVGDSPQGQSRETTVAKIAADAFGVAPDRVRVVLGDTALTPMNNHASHTQSAVSLAATRLRDKVVRIGAHLLGAGDAACAIVEGSVIVRDEPERAMPLAAIARIAYLRPAFLPLGSDPWLEETAVHESPAMTNGLSAHGCLVEVFPDTGQFEIRDWWYVGDAGRVLNPRFLDAAIHGSIGTGVSNTAYEHYAYNDDGQFVAGTMVDYLMPGPMELPSVHVFHHNTPTPLSALGDKKLASEGVPGGVAPALVQAVEQAVQPLDIRFTSLPLTPSRLWEAIEAARTATTVAAP